MAETMTKVSLDVYITGLCLIVPNTGDDHIAVLMPRTKDFVCPPDHSGRHGGEDHDGSGGGARTDHDASRHIEEHRTVLLIHERHLDSSDCEEKKGSWCTIELAGWKLRLSNGTGLTNRDLRGVYKLHQPSRLHRIAKTTFGSELQARVDIASGKHRHTPGGKRFRLDGGKHGMPNYVHWVIDEFEPTLTLTALDGSSSKTIRLNPAGESRIALHVLCVPESEIEPPNGSHGKPLPGTKMTHFLALGQLLEAGHTPIDAPVWEDAAGDDTVVILSATGGNPYTCMPGEGGP